MTIITRAPQPTIAGQRAYLLDSGYTLGRGNDIDAAICRESRCDRCRHAGLSYEPWRRTRLTDMSYVALAICPRCEHWEEF